MPDAPLDYLPAGTKLRPLRDRIIIKPLEWDASRIIFAIRNGRPVRGEVIAVGPGCYPKKYAKDRSSYRLSKHFQRTEVKPGDIVELGGLNIFDGAGYSFPEIAIGTERYLICQEQDVCGVVLPQVQADANAAAA